MYSLRKWLYKPKKSDTSLLAQFYHSDEELYLVASELDSFDGRRDPERCAMLVNELRFWQDSVLNTIEKVMDDAIPNLRTSRDFRVKFPDDVLHESLAGQLWFGAECLAAGSIIMNREVESASMRPLARALTKNLDSLRATLRDQCLRSIITYTDRVKEALVIFDKLLAEFELSYVSSMVPVKTMKEYDLMQEVIVLFSETLHRSLRMGLLTQDQVDDYEPAVMFTIPRLAIVCGLLVYPEGPLNPDNNPHNMSEMFRPFQTLLYKIRELLYTLTGEELYQLEKLLCSQDSSFSLSEEYVTFTDHSQQQLNKDGNPLTRAAQSLIRNKKDAPTSLLCDTNLASTNHIIVHSPDSGGSPVTPVNDYDDDASYLPSSVSKSASLATIVAKLPSVDDESVSDASLEENDEYMRSDIAAIAEVIEPVGDGCRGKRTHKDSDSGLLSDCGSGVEVVVSMVGDDDDDDASSARDVTGCRGNSVNCRGDGGDTVCCHDDGGDTIWCRDDGSDIVHCHGDNINRSHTDGGASYRDDNEIYLCGCHNNDVKISRDDSSCCRGNIDHNLDRFQRCHSVDVPLSTHRHICTNRQRKYVRSVSESHISPPLDMNRCKLYRNHTDDVRYDSDVTDTEFNANCDTDSNVNAACCELHEDELYKQKHDNFMSENEFYKLKNENLTSKSATSIRDAVTKPFDSYDCDTTNASLYYTTSDTKSFCPYNAENISESKNTNWDGYTDNVNSITSLQNEVSSLSVDEIEVLNNSEIFADFLTSVEQNSENLTPSEYRHTDVYSCYTTTGEIDETITAESDLTESQNSENMTNIDNPSPEKLPIQYDYFTTAESDNAHFTCSSHGNNHGNLHSSNHGTRRYGHNTCCNRGHSINTNKTGCLKHKSDSSLSNPVIPPDVKCGKKEGRVGVGPSVCCGPVGVTGPSVCCGPDMCGICPRCSTGTDASMEAVYMGNDLDTRSIASSDTSSYNSESHDDEEIALAIQAAEMASRNEVRSRFQNSSDLIHRLFVCVSGVADQLQTNYASDLRNILKCVFDMSCSDPPTDTPTKPAVTAATRIGERSQGSSGETIQSSSSSSGEGSRHSSSLRDTPPWLPDVASASCMGCHAPFTLVRRRHHCRNCGKLFCSRCSSNVVPLPNIGHPRPVRVCIRCFIYHVTPFTASSSSAP